MPYGDCSSVIDTLLSELEKDPVRFRFLSHRVVARGRAAPRGAQHGLCSVRGVVAAGDRVSAIAGARDALRGRSVHVGSRVHRGDQSGRRVPGASWGPVWKKPSAPTWISSTTRSPTSRRRRSSTNASRSDAARTTRPWICSRAVSTRSDSSKCGPASKPPADCACSATSSASPCSAARSAMCSRCIRTSTARAVGVLWGE